MILILLEIIYWWSVYSWPR